VRTCKHLRSTLGEDFENWRVRNAPGAARAGQAPAAKRARAAGGGGGGGGGGAGAAAPDLMLAHKWDEDTHDPTGWWISEK
jgi:hypothetical protein